MNQTTQGTRPGRHLLGELFLAFLKIGAFTFGGGYAMLPLIKKEVVETRSWLDEDEFLDALAVAQSSPGPVAVNTAVFTGYRMRGVSGAIIAALGVTLPSFAVILAIATVFTAFRSLPVVQRAFMGVRAAVAGLILSAAVTLARRAMPDRASLFLGTAALIILLTRKIHPIAAILGGASAGYLGFRAARGRGGDAA